MGSRAGPGAGMNCSALTLACQVVSLRRAVQSDFAGMCVVGFPVLTHVSLP